MTVHYKGKDRPNNLHPSYKAWSRMRHNVLRKHQVSGWVEAWNTFEGFLADMGTRPKDHIFMRKDKTKVYGPDNCYWKKPPPKKAKKKGGPHPKNPDIQFPIFPSM